MDKTRLTAYYSSTSESETEIPQSENNPVSYTIMIDNAYGSDLDLDPVVSKRKEINVDSAYGSDLDLRACDFIKQKSQDEKNEEKILESEEDMDVITTTIKLDAVENDPSRIGKKIKLEFLSKPKTESPSLSRSETDERDEKLDFSDDEDSEEDEESNESESMDNREEIMEFVKLINENYRTEVDDKYDSAFADLSKVFEQVSHQKKKIQPSYDINGRLRPDRRVFTSNTSIQRGIAVPRNGFRSLRPRNARKAPNIEENSQQIQHRGGDSLSRLHQILRDEGGMSESDIKKLTAEEQRSLRSIISEHSYVDSDRTNVDDMTHSRFDDALRKFGLDKIFSPPKIVRTDREWNVKLENFRVLKMKRDERLDRLRRKKVRKEKRKCPFHPVINRGFSTDKIDNQKPLHERYLKVMKEKKRNLMKLSVSLAKHRERELTFSPRTNRRKGILEKNDWTVNKFDLWEREKKKKIETKRKLLKDIESRKRKELFKPKIYVSNKRSKKLVRNIGGDVFVRNYYDERRKRNIQLKKKKERSLMSLQHSNVKKKRKWMIDFDQQDEEEEQFRSLLRRYRKKRTEY